MNPLAELKDIHLPAPAPWWELAMGWWLLMALIVVLLVWGVPKLKIWFQQRAKKKVLRVSVNENLLVIRQSYQEHQNRSQAVAEVSTYLRRVALTLFKGTHVAGLVGEPWLDFLDAQWVKEMPEPSFKNQDIKLLLSMGAYQPVSHIDKKALESLFSLTEAWVEEVVKHHV
ncbi:MAG: DUF4381 domain-containing protein [Ghiorsea sp.]